MVEVMKIIVTSFKKFCACTAALSAPDPAAGHHWSMPLLETPRHSWASLGQSLVGSLLLSSGCWCTQVSVCAFQVSVSPVLHKFWWLCVRVDGELLQVGLCHTYVCCTHSPCPCGSALLIHTSAGDTQTLKGRSGWVSLSLSLSLSDSFLMAALPNSETMPWAELICTLDSFSQHCHNSIKLKIW